MYWVPLVWRVPGQQGWWPASCLTCCLISVRPELGITFRESTQELQGLRKRPRVCDRPLSPLLQGCKSASGPLQSLGLWPEGLGPLAQRCGFYAIFLRQVWLEVR